MRAQEFRGEEPLQAAQAHHGGVQPAQDVQGPGMIGIGLTHTDAPALTLTAPNRINLAYDPAALAPARAALLAAWERLMDRIPIVKSVYGAVRDFVQMLPSGGERRELRRVVLARFADAAAIGFVTRDDAGELGLGAAAEGTVAVYFPMSYQIGGYTLLLPRSDLEPLDLAVETAMRLVLTGGMSGPTAKQ